MRRAALVAGLCATLLAGAEPAVAQAPPTEVAFWAGEEFIWEQPGAPFDPPPEAYWYPRDLSAYTEDLWALVASQRGPLYVNLRYRRDFGPLPEGMPARTDGLALVKEANERGIPVWAWVVVPFTDGYWAYEGNAELHLEAVRALHAWAEANGLRLEGVTLDSEPSIQETRDLYDAFSNRPWALPSFFRSTVDPARHCAAVARYRALLAEERQRGTRLSVAAYPAVLDDLRDGFVALQDALDVVTSPPLGWSELYFMAYRSVYASLFRSDPGSGLAASYARSASEAFGQAGQITLGVAGEGPYASLDELVRDVRVLATLGMRRVPIYSLELAVRHYQLEGVRRLVEAARQPFEGLDALAATAPTPGSVAARTFLTAADLALAATTPLITAGSAHGPQLPSSYPDGCP